MGQGGPEGNLVQVHSTGLELSECLHCMCGENDLTGAGVLSRAGKCYRVERCEYCCVYAVLACLRARCSGFRCTLASDKFLRLAA